MSDHDELPSPVGHTDVFENSSGETFIKIHSGLPGNHPFFVLIGRVASAWTYFEHILDEIIWNISQIPEDLALCITGQIMGATPRLKIIEALCKYLGLPEPLLKKAKKLKELQYGVAEQRNRIVHDPWFLVREPFGPIQTTQLKSSPPGHQEVTENEIRKTLTKIEALAAQAANLQLEFRETLYALRQKRNEPPPPSRGPEAQ